jgi:hypothetical protein
MAVPLTPASSWLRSHLEEFRDRPFEWVAATAEGPVGIDADLSRLIAQVLVAGLFGDDVAYALVDAPVEGGSIR